MLKSKYLDFDGRQYGTDVIHYFLTGGYVFDINPNLKFKPFAMIKSSVNAPTSLDVSTNFMIYDKLELGATYRLEDSFGAMVNFAITPSLRIGYAYDHIVSDINVVTPASHEVILLFDLNFPKKVSRSPRYF
jgi:type IX secretion system PorP/SprF family membrane protein